MPHKVLIWIIWGCSAILFICIGVGMGIFGFASIGSPNRSIMEREYYDIFYTILFIVLPLFQFTTILFALYAQKHWYPIIAYLIIFLPYILAPVIVLIGEKKGENIRAEAVKLQEEFYQLPQLTELESHRLKLEFHSDDKNLWQQTLQQIKQDGFICNEELNKKVMQDEISSDYYIWDEAPAPEELLLSGYSKTNDTIYSGYAADFGNFLIATTPGAEKYVRNLFSALPGPKFDNTALQKIWWYDAIDNMSMFLEFWPAEKGSKRS